MFRLENIGYFLISWLLLGCYDNADMNHIDARLPQAEIKNRANATVLHDDELSKILKNWHLDSLGCLEGRDSRKARRLVADLRLIGRTQDDVTALLGPPNEALPYSWYTPLNDTISYAYIRYYFATICENNAIVEESDKCWADFLFSAETDTLVRMLISCN